MENKLQALADKLYQDGLSKGKEEGERILAQARQEASRILEEAKGQAGKILEEARQESEDMRKNSLTEITIASRQMLSRVKGEMETALLEKTLAPAVHAAMEEKAFVQELILKLVSAFRPEEQSALPLVLVLPEADRAAFDGFLHEGLAKALKEGLEVKFSGDLPGGFRIANREKGYLLSFTEEDFQALFAEYARPRIKQMLYQ